MQHLMIETIARLVDEPATPEEQAHIDACEDCSTQLQAMRADLAALHDLPMIEPPPTEWPEIEARLLEEGLIRRRRGPRFRGTSLRAAASIAVFALGAASGIAWTRTGSTPIGSPVRSGRATGAAPTLIAATEPTNREEAIELYRQAEALYLDALTRVAEIDEPQSGGDPLARLAALEGIAAITRSALDQAPADPVLNGYHLTALAQKEATLRMIAASKADGWF
jgi:hypothetical protein